MIVAIVLARVGLGSVEGVDPLLAINTIELRLANTLTKLLGTHTVSSAVVRARILMDGAVHTFPLMAAEACAIVADAIVVALIWTSGHGAV